VQAREGVGQFRVAVPAVLGAIAVLDFSFIGDAVTGRAGLVEKVLQQVDRVVEEVGVGGADIDVQFALQVGPQLVPIALQDGVQVVVIVPVGCDMVIDGAGLLVEDLRRIAVWAHRSVDCLPNVELLP
jgi:hypothetical protein